MRLRRTAIFIIVLLLLTLVPTTAFADTPSSWAKDGVSRAIVTGLVPASLQSRYTQPATRAEFCTLAVTLYESLKGEITGRTTFTDTNDVNVQKAAAVGIVNGVGNGRFDPNAKLTREQAATMLTRLADTVGQPLPLSAAAFADNAAIASWAREAVGQMQASGIMSGVGNGNFAPKGDYTREQSILTAMRTYITVKGGKPDSLYSGKYHGALQGSAKIMDGKTLLISIFVSADGSALSDYQINVVRDKLDIAKNFIESEGKKYGKAIDLICDYNKYPDLRYDMEFTGEFFILPENAVAGGLTAEQRLVSDRTDEILHRFIENTIPYLALADKYQTDSIGYLVHLNYKDSYQNYATVYDAEFKIVNWYHERAVSFLRASQVPSTLAHEILHVFGAVDLYAPYAYRGVSQALADYAKYNYPDEIMVGGWSYDASGEFVYDGIPKEISRITAYCLGWLDDIPELTMFPELRREHPAVFTDQTKIPVT